jgi:hypothetical protein
MRAGRVVESGTHNQLLSAQGPYHALVAQQLACHDHDREAATSNGVDDETGDGDGDGGGEAAPGTEAEQQTPAHTPTSV